MQKITPSWKAADLAANVRRPLFYAYMLVAALLLVLGLLMLWMTIDDRSRALSGRVVSFGLAVALVRASHAAASFKVRGKSWLAIVTGCLLLLPAVVIPLAEGPQDLDFVVFAASAGTILLLWGVYAWRAVRWPAAPRASGAV